MKQLFKSISNNNNANYVDLVNKNLEIILSKIKNDVSVDSLTKGIKE
jgi:hypothetical protein